MFGLFNKKKEEEDKVKRQRKAAECRPTMK
jgi:hypothetical protein